MKTQHIVTAIAAWAAIFTTIAAPAAEPPAPYGAVPSEKQIQWHRLEWYGFVHYGINTFIGADWGYGDEDPALFNPPNLEADEIVGAFKKAGMKGLIFTAKHHIGFCHWPTKSTDYNLTKSPWKDGKGDVVREFADACKRQGMLFGVYISPWDRHSANYGGPGYLKEFYTQIEETLTNYGDVFEMWFDGCNKGTGYYGGARETRNVGDADTYYNFPHVVELINRLQPNCIVWGAAGHGDVMWGGSEEGFVKYPYWNVTDVTGKVYEMAPRNLPDKESPNERWLPFEADTSMTGRFWYWHNDLDKFLKSPRKLMDDVYMKSVGRGANLILNVPVNKDGVIDAQTKNALLRLGKARELLLASDCALDAKGTASNVRGEDVQQFGPGKLTDNDIESYWCTDDDVTTGEVELQLKKPATFDVVRVREQIRLGQRVQNFAVDAWVDGKWVTIDAEEPNGKSIGHQVMRRVQPTTTDRVRLRITRSRACPCISELSLLKMPDDSEVEFTAYDKMELYVISHQKRAAIIAGGILALLLALGSTLVLVIRRRRNRNKGDREHA